MLCCVCTIGLPRGTKSSSSSSSKRVQDFFSFHYILRVGFRVKTHEKKKGKEEDDDDEDEEDEDKDEEMIPFFLLVCSLRYLKK